MHYGKRDTAQQLAAQVNQLFLVEHINILIASLIGYLVILRLPRALARLWKTSEWSEGYFLQYKTGNGWRLPIGENPPNESTSATTSKPHSFRNRGARPLVDSEGILRPTYPPHIPAYPAFLHPFVEHLRLSIVPGCSNLQVLVMLAYLGILLYAFSYRSNFLENPIRSGLIAASQLPFVYTFAAKNNVAGLLLGIGYESMNYFHRYVGRLVVLAVNVHAIGFFYRWTTLNTISAAFTNPSNRWGLVTLTCMDIIFVFSTSIIREKAYNIFRMTHLVGYLLIIPALYMHHPITLPFIIAVSVTYLLDRVLCLLKTRYVTATIRALPTLSATRIEIHSLTYGWRAGQHVRIRVLFKSLGWFRWTEPHPFTIASAPANSKDGLVGEDGLILICKNAGGWTSRLFNTAKASQTNESGAADASRMVRVLIEGPYGGPGHTMFTSFSAVVMVIGGSGITFSLSTIQDLVQKGLRGESCVKVIELVWVVQTEDAIAPLLPLLTSFISSCSYLSISVHYTRPYAPTGRKSGSSSASGLDQSEVDLSGHDIAKYPGRPGRRHLVSIMESAITRAIGDINYSIATITSSQFIPSGMLVCVCGPKGLSKDVVAAVSDIDSKLKSWIGGVEMHQETYAF